MAAPGPSNVIARPMVDDPLEFNGETSVSNALSFSTPNKLLKGFQLKIGGEVFDSLMSLREDRRNENDKLLGLNDLIAQALKEIQAKEAHVDATNNSCWGRGWMSFVLVTSGLVILLIVLVYGLLGLVFKVLLSFVIVVLL
ncbi:hypothetical protein Tco_1280943 [Tanacetum coccineum]